MELVIDRGVKSYDVKDADGTLLGVIKINPADIGISGRFVSARNAIAELAEQAKAGSHQRTPGLDMMGYVVRRTYTIIRGRNFVKLRRAILRAQRDLDALGYVPWWRAQRIMSQWGEIKHSDSRGFCQKYNVYKIIRAAKRSVSWHSKQLLLKEQTHGAVC